MNRQQVVMDDYDPELLDSNMQILLNDLKDQGMMSMRDVLCAMRFSQFLETCDQDDLQLALQTKKKDYCEKLVQHFMFWKPSVRRFFCDCDNNLTNAESKDKDKEMEEFLPKCIRSYGIKACSFKWALILHNIDDHWINWETDVSRCSEIVRAILTRIRTQVVKELSQSVYFSAPCPSDIKWKEYLPRTERSETKRESHSNNDAKSDSKEEKREGKEEKKETEKEMPALLGETSAPGGYRPISLLSTINTSSSYSSLSSSSSSSCSSRSLPPRPSSSVVSSVSSSLAPVSVSATVTIAPPSSLSLLPSSSSAASSSSAPVSTSATATITTPAPSSSLSLLPSSTTPIPPLIPTTPASSSAVNPDPVLVTISQTNDDSKI